MIFLLQVHFGEGGVGAGFIFVMLFDNASFGIKGFVSASDVLWDLKVPKMIFLPTLILVHVARTGAKRSLQLSQVLPGSCISTFCKGKAHRNLCHSKMHQSIMSNAKHQVQSRVARRHASARTH